MIELVLKYAGEACVHKTFGGNYCRIGEFRSYGSVSSERFQDFIDAGWSSPVAREAHNLEVAGSNPVPAIFGSAKNRAGEGRK
jgi:hypothetical protein